MTDHMSKLRSGLMVLSMASAVMSSSQADTGKLNLDIDGNMAGPALVQLGQSSGFQIFFTSDVVNQIKLPDIKGEYTLAEALNVMLKNTGLTYEFTSEDSLVVKKETGNAGTARSDSADSKSELVEEIIITATRREGGLRDAPMAVSALSAESLEKMGAVGFDGYLSTMPGVTFQERGNSRNQIIIRGITGGPQTEDPTAAAYFGEMPLTGLTVPSNDGSSGSPDIKMVDVQRVEILRGPQGTIYGAGSMSGVVRTIPASPNLTETEGEITSGVSSTGGSGGINTSLQAVLNAPLKEDVFALRAVAYRFDDSGYIDNVLASQIQPWAETAVSLGAVARDRGDIGHSVVTGLRLAGLWRPADDLDITLTYINQEQEQDGFPEVDLSLAGNFQQARLNVDPIGSDYEQLTHELNLVNFVVDYDLSWAKLTSSTSWLYNDGQSKGDFAFALGGAPYSILNDRDQNVFVQEIRLASQFDGPFQFLAGMYYEDNQTRYFASTTWSGSAEEEENTPFLYYQYGGSEGYGEQKAVFGEVSYTFAEQFTASLGARLFDYSRGFDQLADLFYITPRVIQQKHSKNQDGSTIKASLDWKPNDDVMFYSQYAEGFRMGRLVNGNALAKIQCDNNNDGTIDQIGYDIPDQLDSDTTKNYEIGAKTSILDGRLTVNAAAFRIDWEGIPVRTTFDGCEYSVYLNAGKTKSEGIELEAQAFLSDRLKMHLNVFYGESTLSEDTPSIGNKGDDLPGSADLTVSTGLEYGFELAGNPSFARVDYTYVGEYYSDVAETDPAVGDYSLINLRAGIEFGDLGLDLFVKNLTDTDSLTWVEQVWGGVRGYRLRPRTIGMNLSYRF